MASDNNQPLFSQDDDISLLEDDTEFTTTSPASEDEAGINPGVIYAVLFTVFFFLLVGSVTIIIVYLVRSYKKHQEEKALVKGAAMMTLQYQRAAGLSFSGSNSSGNEPETEEEREDRDYEARRYSTNFDPYNKLNRMHMW